MSKVFFALCVHIVPRPPLTCPLHPHSPPQWVIDTLGQQDSVNEDERDDGTQDHPLPEEPFDEEDDGKAHGEYWFPKGTFPKWLFVLQLLFIEKYG